MSASYQYHALATNTPPSLIQATMYRAKYHLIGLTSNPKRSCSNISKRSLLKYFIYTTLTCIFISFLNGLLRPSYLSPPAHYEDLRLQIESVDDIGRGNPNNEKIFIAANIINANFIRDPWGPTLVKLVDILGPENVFVSVYENDSGEDTPRALLELKDHLTCETSFVVGDHLPLELFPQIVTPDGTARTKRITYLAEARNRLLKPLDPPSTTKEWSRDHPLFKSAHSRHFDRVLFLNDVYFDPVEAAQLLFSTNRDETTGRANYDVACAGDFLNHGQIYDSFVIRSSDGYGMGLPFYPWFPATGNQDSRNDVLSQTDAVRVRSCWNGMVSFSASHFRPQSVPALTSHESTSSPSIIDSLRSSLSLQPHSDSASPPNTDVLPAIRFRSSPEAFWEESECCLVFADIEARKGLLTSFSGSSNDTLTPHPAHSPSGVFLNPYIRVTYNSHAFNHLSSYKRWERQWQFLQYWVSKIGYPEYNPRRTETPGQIVTRKEWVADESRAKHGRWETGETAARGGGWCGQQRGFYLKGDLERANREGGELGKNWIKVKVPWW